MIRVLLASLILAGCAAQSPVQYQVGKYDQLDKLMEYALDGYAQGDMLRVRNMELVLKNLMAGVDTSQLATVPGLRIAMAGRLAERCDQSEDPHSLECYASAKARRFFDIVEITVRQIGWDIDATYTIAEYESRARRALALYPWAIDS